MDPVAPIAPSPIIRQSCHASYLTMIEIKNTRLGPIQNLSNQLLRWLVILIEQHNHGGGTIIIFSIVL